MLTKRGKNCQAQSFGDSYSNTALVLAKNIVTFLQVRWTNL